MVAASLEDAIQAVARQVASPRARCLIVNEGAPDESSLMGTRDGYLNLALAILRFVADADAGRCETDGQGHVWDDRIKSVMYQSPSAVVTLDRRGLPVRQPRRVHGRVEPVA